MTAMNDRDADRLELLDRIADRVPELDLVQHSVVWTTPTTATRRCSSTAAGSTAAPAPSSHNAGDDVHAVGTLGPIVEGYVGCMVIQPDGSRYRPRAVPDPLAE